MMEVSTGVKDEKGNEHCRNKEDEVHPQEEGPGKKTRANIKKRDKENYLDDIQLISDRAETMDMLELKATELVKNTTS